MRTRACNETPIFLRTRVSLVRETTVQTDTMGSALSQEFNKIEADQRVDSLIELVKECSYQQKLEFVVKLNRLMYRDFLVELPQALSHRVILYLSIDEACVCLLVSKKWNEIVSQCKSLWETVACDISLSDAFINENLSKYKSLKDLCIAARGHQKYVSSLTVQAISIAQCPTQPRYSYQYAGRGITLHYEEINSHAKIIIEKMGTLNTPVQIAEYITPAYSSRVKWAAASNTHLIWKQLCGKWNSCDVSEGCDGVVCQWDDEPVSQAFHSISICQTCHLVAIISEAEDDCEVWDLQVVKLTQGKVAARKTVYPVPLEHMQITGAKIRHFLGGEVTLLPERITKTRHGFCEAHFVLLQVDNTVAVHRLETVAKAESVVISPRLFPDVKLSQPLHIFNPTRTTGKIDALSNSPSRGPSKFVVSRDYLHLGLFHESYLYMWSLSSYTEEIVTDLIEHNLPRDTQCIAIGSLYAVLISNSRGTCSIISVESGEIVTSGVLADISYNVHGGSSRFNFYPPLSENWLSSLCYYDLLPLAVVFDDSPNFDSTCKEFQAVVGAHSQSKPRR